ncbi:MAG TPA: prephenate dehydrogenase/arogenate dehydrogenase family protein [Candidatus Limnocylindria bacterium]|nr:prephenate dehydrogenase/arogenate dehydrogenase family protein [Candidatus Limnocylindria bacterium]
MIARLAIVGVGLLGGSVARAARARGLAGHITGIGRDRERLAPAQQDGTLDAVTTDVAEGVRDADVIVLAATVLANDTLLAQVWQAAPPGAVVTDVGSTKRGIVAAAGRLGGQRRVRFVGSHPMAGSERSGYAIARADLFDGATVIVTPTETTDPDGVKTVVGFWEATGARVATMDPDAHDRAMAAISHLPHVVAWALVDAVARFEPGALDVAARGFKDTTRIAASDPLVWTEILLANRDAVAASVRAFRDALDDLERRIAAGDGAAVEATLARIKALREAVK